MARAQEHHDGLFEFVLSQLRRGGDTDALREVLQLFAIPVAVLEVAHRHRRREGVGHAATAYLFRQRRPRVVASLSRLLDQAPAGLRTSRRPLRPTSPASIAFSSLPSPPARPPTVVRALVET